MGNDITFQQAPASWIILIVTVGISLLAMSNRRKFLFELALRPYSIFNEGKYWQIITSGFVHSDFVHLLFNMLTFYFFAMYLEIQTGTQNFLIIYFASMILSDISTIFKNRNNERYMALGASGAVSGVVFSMILYFPTMKLGILLIPIPMPAYIFGLLYLAYCYFAAKQNRDFINHDAHLWGALAGIIITILLDPGVITNFLNSF